MVQSRQAALGPGHRAVPKGRGQVGPVEHETLVVSFGPTLGAPVRNRALATSQAGTHIDPVLELSHDER